MTKLEQLERFFSENDIWYNRKVLKIVYDSNLEGFDVLCRNPKSAKVGDILCKIPKESVLSVKTTAISEILEEFDISGCLGLIISLLFEQSQGEKSPWNGYLSSLPERAELPIFWKDDEIEWLRNTEIYADIKSDNAAMLEDYNGTVIPLLTKYPELFPRAFFTFENFKSASSLVSSRAFLVDNWHFDSMVPLADIFNHQTNKGSQYGEHLHIESNPIACPYCGESGPCEHDDDDDDDDALDTNVEDVSDTEVDVDPSIMNMTLVKPLTINETVFNTYGNHSSGSLLLKYGFTDPFPNDNDVCTFAYDCISRVLINKFKIPASQCAYRAGLWMKERRQWVGVFLKGEDVDPDEMEVELSNKDPSHLFFRANKDGTFDRDLVAFLILMTATEQQSEQMANFQLDAFFALSNHLLGKLLHSKAAFDAALIKYKLSFVDFRKLFKRVLDIFIELIGDRLAGYKSDAEHDAVELENLANVTKLDDMQRKRIYALRVLISEKRLLGNLLELLKQLM